MRPTILLGHVTQAWLVTSDEPQARRPAAIGTISNGSIPRGGTRRGVSNGAAGAVARAGGVNLPQA